MKGKTVIVGVGNLLLRDEGVGVHVARALQERALPVGTAVRECGTTLLDCWDEFRDAEKVVIVDAVQGGEEPGSIYRIPGEALAGDHRGGMSCHDIGIGEVLGLKWRGGPEVVVIGVEPAEIEWRLELSPPIQARLDRILDVVVEEATKPTRCNTGGR